MLEFEIKEGYLYTCVAATFAKTSVVKRGSVLRVEFSKDQELKGMTGVGFTNVVVAVDPATGQKYEFPKYTFQMCFEPVSTTIVSPVVD